MPLFKRNPFARPSGSSTFGGIAENGHLANVSAGYRRFVRSNPFIAFGLPFIGTMVAGSFFLTPATAIRYERFDRKTHTMNREEAMALGFQNLGGGSQQASSDDQSTAPKKDKKVGGKFQNKDIREEYYKLAGLSEKLDDWEPVRVKRLSGEPDGTFD